LERKEKKNQKNRKKTDLGLQTNSNPEKRHNPKIEVNEQTPKKRRNSFTSSIHEEDLLDQSPNLRFSTSGEPDKKTQETKKKVKKENEKIFDEN